MPTINEVYERALKEAKDGVFSSADVRIIIAHDQGFPDQISVIFHKNEELKDPALFEKQMELLRTGEPVEYIINEASFLGHRLYVDNRVLIPRGETEELVANITERIGDYFDPRNYLVVADIGTGSGAISIALKNAFPHWLITATDISKDALEVAKVNFHNCNAQVRVAEGDALSPFIGKSNLDIIVSNPPYIRNKEDAQPSVKDFEPSSALWFSEERNVYKSIFEDVYKVKKGPLFMAFEISPDLEEYLTSLMGETLHNYSFEFVKDLNSLTRFLFVYLKEDVPNAEA